VRRRAFPKQKLMPFPPHRKKHPMAESRPETLGPEHHLRKPNWVIMSVIGLAGGTALLFGVMVWYFTKVDPSGAPPRLKENAAKSSPADKGNGSLAWEKDVVEIVPLSELHVKIASGSAESVATPPGSGLTATLEGNSVKITAAKDAKAGPHQVTVRDAQGKQATHNVNVKQ
jgi:hypothetical protein